VRGAAKSVCDEIVDGGFLLGAFLTGSVMTN